MKIYVTRHGQTDMNVKELLNGKRSDEDINDTGIQQAKIISEFMKDKKVDLIISSPMLRTRHTSEIINVKCAPIIEDDRIIDLDLGNGTFKGYDYMIFEDYYNLNRKGSYKDIEDIDKLIKRVYDFLDSLKEKNKRETILIVTHAAVAKVIHMYFYGIPKSNNIDEYYLENCQIREYEML